MNKNAYKILDPSFAIDKGKLKIHKNNTFEHELAKFLVMYEEIMNGGEVYSEARFLNKSRADIYNITSNTAIEIVNSETEKSIENKKNKYPCNIIFLKSQDVINHWFKSRP